ncbi:hypothetical protein EDD11_005022 [Mortierella claussenii]|nr:hypothetical protein EDD11_005022 [Mortierella claussenii]
MDHSASPGAEDSPANHQHETTSTPGGHLPTEIILLILVHLDHHTLLAAALTCRRWHALAKRYRQYLWKHLALRDFSFTAARGLWKLEFLKDRDLQLCFPLSAPPLMQQDHRRTAAYRRQQRNSLCGFCTRRLERVDNADIMQATFSLSNWGLGMNMDPKNSETDGMRSMVTKTQIRACSCVPPKEGKGKQRADMKDKAKTSSGWKAAAPTMMDSIHYDKDGEDDEWRMGDQEQDWKALYQLTSNWYRGRAKGYCPLMLPSLTTLASATQTLSESSIVAQSSPFDGSAARSKANSTLQTISTPAQRAIQRILKRRKPQAVVGLQHEGSALTALSLASLPVKNLTWEFGRATEDVDAVPNSDREVVLIRSNPHYREKRFSGAPGNRHQQLQPFSTSGNTSSTQSTGFNIPSVAQKPNIVAQDPLEHDQIMFAIQSRPTTQSESNNSTSEGVDAVETIPHPEQLPLAAQSVADPPVAAFSPSLTTQLSDDPANDILCHYSSPLHSFLATGHMDGSVRLWDLLVTDPGQQCIRHWQTGPRRRVLCVGMNSRVVVCGNADSTLCVWDIHPGPSSSPSSHGTIHSASYIASTTPPGLDDWISGIEHICVGDSLVACSTEFSGSVLVFSLATGSLVYEIPGLYQPSKMCMTDFFLLTGGRGAWNQGGRMRQHNQQQQQQQQQHHQHHYDHHHLAGAVGETGGGAGHADQRAHQQGSAATAIEVDEHMSCCINVWDLRTGDRLYSLIPRLPVQNLQQVRMSLLANSPLHQQARSSRHPRTAVSLSHGGRTWTATRLPDMSITEHHRSLSSGARDVHLDTLSQSIDELPSHVAGAGEGSSARPTDDSDQSNSSSFSSSSWSLSSSLMSGQSGTVSGPLQWKRGPLGPSVQQTQSSFKTLQSPISAPLTLLDIAVTSDHSTLVATLCERSGEGREGVYCWDFSGSRLEGYHEHGYEVSTVILDKNDLEYREGQSLETMRRNSSSSRTEKENMGPLQSEHMKDELSDDDEDAEGDGEVSDGDDDDDFYSNDRLNNNMVMQQVDSAALRNLHQARITGKVWIGWKLDEQEFRRRKAVYQERKLRKRQGRKQKNTAGSEQEKESERDSAVRL